MPCSSKAAASLAEYSNGITRLRSLSKFSPSSAIQSANTSNCVCTACALVKVAPIPRLLTRYLRAGPRKVAVPGYRAAGLDDLGRQFLFSRPWLGAEPDAGHSVPKHRGAKLRVTRSYAPEEVSVECMRIEVTINVLLV